MDSFNRNRNTKTETNVEKVRRLIPPAKKIIDLLKSVFTVSKKIDITRVMLCAAGLAGISCHEAVKALHEPMVLITIEDGRVYYYGDSINKYLLESETSVYAFIKGATGLTDDDMLEMVGNVTSNLGNDKFVIAGVTPDTLYKDIKYIWDKLFTTVTVPYCKTPDEWSLLYTIVLQNVILKAIEIGAPKEEVLKNTMTCAIVLSKMDLNSLKETD